MSRAFVPAAGRDFLLPLYDPLWNWLGGDRIRARFIRDAGLAAGQRVLDIGCGTGSLLIQINETVPGIQASGLDPDPKALSRCAAKAASADVGIEWSEGFADALPYADASFDRVVSSFMFHHLDLNVKNGMLREARRVLTAGGELHLVDFGGQHHGKEGVLARVLHSHEGLVDNRGGRILELFEDAGFVDVVEVSHNRFVFGGYAHVRGIAR
jgi:ubiquinone/menaquinone biosynthesis C-methylase UbiE